MALLQPGVYMSNANSVKATDSDTPPYAINYGLPENLLKDGQPIYCGLSGPGSEVVQFHLAVWITTQKPNSNNYGIIRSVSKTANQYSESLTLLFSEKDDCEQFKTWFNDYTARFGPNDEWRSSMYPRPQAGKLVSGYVLPLNTMEDFYNSALGNPQLFETWCWIVANIAEPVLYTRDCWLFANEQDMLMVKLRNQ